MSTSRHCQQAFRAKLRDMNLQPCEIWLDPHTKALLNDITARYEGSKQENYSKVILAALTALKNKDDDVTCNVVEIWHNEKRCQAKTMRGRR